MGDVFDPACDPNNPIHVIFDQVEQAADGLGDTIIHSPCIKSHLSVQTQIDLYIKKEFLQFTGSYKDRGARWSMENLPPEKRGLGVVAASAGNHAQALAYHGQQLGIPVTVVMPVIAPLMKINKCKMYGADVVVQGANMTEAKEIALRFAKEKGMTYINGYDHPHILAGAGTCGVEICNQVQDIDAVIIPIGGGGLIAGASCAIKKLSPNTKVIGAESERCPGMTSAIEAGGPVAAECGVTLADGLAVSMVGVNSYETARHYIDKLVVVKEEIISVAVLALLELEKCVCEGAGATALAAIFSGALPELNGKRVVIVLSGGNIDSTVLLRVIDRGLAVLGRLVKFWVIVKDKPGGLTELLDKLNELGAHIREVIHERAFVYRDAFSVKVRLVCETRNIDHALEVKEMLDENYGNDVDFSYFPNACTAKTLGF